MRSVEKGGVVLDPTGDDDPISCEPSDRRRRVPTYYVPTRVGKALGDPRPNVLVKPEDTILVGHPGVIADRDDRVPLDLVHPTGLVEVGIDQRVEHADRLVAFRREQLGIAGRDRAHVVDRAD